MKNDLRREQALEYHAKGRPGKIEVVPTKEAKTQRDLSLAYSPGVAEPCKEIAANVEEVYTYTAKGNLVGVITNGTAVLGLGDIGPEASKPVMEGKGVLFKIFADIDVFDIEINEKDPKKFVDIVAALEPTFGGINLEDIKAPECFEIERNLRERLKIPVMHDDQHGTAIISSAALLNALELQKKKIDRVKFVVNGAGAAAMACVPDRRYGWPWRGRDPRNTLLRSPAPVMQTVIQKRFAMRSVRIATRAARLTTNASCTCSPINWPPAGAATVSRSRSITWACRVTKARARRFIWKKLSTARVFARQSACQSHGRLGKPA